MPTCKFDRRLKCKETKCDERCIRFRQSGQQKLMGPKIDVVKVKKERGVETVYYRVEK